MATLEERLRRLTSNKPPEQKQPQQESPIPKPVAKPKLAQSMEDNQPQSKGLKKNKIEIPKIDTVVQGIKEEANSMEHSMVAKLCNDLTRFMFGIFTYPLELLDSWIVCKNILPNFTKHATTVWFYFSIIAILAGILLVIFAHDITIIIAALLFAVAGYLMLGVK